MPTRLAERDANFRWTVERLSYADYEFLCDLPPRLEWELPGYGRVVAVHATPPRTENDPVLGLPRTWATGQVQDKCDETVILPDTPDDQVRPHLIGLDARLLLYGHTHRPVDRTVDGVRLVNDGSVGLPLDGDPRPAYVLLDFAGDRCPVLGLQDKCTVTIRRVAYDLEAVVAELERVEHPVREWINRMLREARA